MHPNSGAACATIPERGPGRPVEFAASTAAITGESKSQINRHVARAEALGDVGYVGSIGFIRRNAGKCHDKKTLALCVSARMNRIALRGTLRGMIGQKRKNPK